MPEVFLQLPRDEQSKILRALGPQLERTPFVLEKDVWVCWVLQYLFTMPGRLPMAFKGGTSLSKVFNAIARFSEDLDITLDYRGLDASFDPFAEGVSKNQLKKFGETLKEFVRAHVHGVVAPYFHDTLAGQFGADTCKVEVRDDGEQLRVHYPSALEPSGNYFGNSVLVEFGGRNITEPSETYQIRPDIANTLTELAFPLAPARVLSPSRTFWEKATLVHVECNRSEFRAQAKRLSRHWYDLAMLADHEIGQQALADRALLADVVRHKKVFYSASYANYDACLAGRLRLLPDAAALPGLNEDFKRMCAAGMFIGQLPSFEHIVERLRALETDINR